MSPKPSFLRNPLNFSQRIQRKQPDHIAHGPPWRRETLPIGWAAHPMDIALAEALLRYMRYLTRPLSDKPLTTSFINLVLIRDPRLAMRTHKAPGAEGQPRK